MAEKDKNPVRGMQPMDDYNTTNKLKELAPLGVGLGLAGAAMTVSKKGAEGDAARKKAREAAEKNREESDKAALKNQKEYGMKKGGKVSSASSRADGIAQRGKTRGMMK